MARLIPALLSKRFNIVALTIAVDFFMAIMAQAQEVPSFLVRSWISIPYLQGKFRPFFQRVNMVNCRGLAISVIDISAALALKLIKLQYFPPDTQPLPPLVKPMRVM